MKWWYSINEILEIERRRYGREIVPFETWEAIATHVLPVGLVKNVKGTLKIHKWVLRKEYYNEEAIAQGEV